MLERLLFSTIYALSFTLTMPQANSMLEYSFSRKRSVGKSTDQCCNCKPMLISGRRLTTNSGLILDRTVSVKRLCKPAKRFNNWWPKKRYLP